MNEIFKLKEMLIKADIPFEFYLEKGGYHLCYPMDGEKRVCSAIQTNFSYGHDVDLIEIMGLLTEEEREENSVLGWLSAEEVFQRIEKHWNLFGGGRKMNEYDWAIFDALEMFNKALKSAKKPKIRKRYPIYPSKMAPASGRKRRKRKAWK